MHLWLIEPYLTGSHQAWAEGYQAHSGHDVSLVALPGRFWKWRMQGGAVTLARKAQALGQKPALILASDMLNLPVFLALGGSRLASVPIALYFHENQLTYPLPPGEKRDLHYGFINFASALRADALFFNSQYHLDALFDELPRLLKHFPDYNELATLPALRAKAQVLPLGLDLGRFHRDPSGQPKTGRPLIVWNHRWEYDKNPTTFFAAIGTLAGEGLDFGLILLGESFRNQPSEFLEARERLGARIIHFGYAEDGTAGEYGRLLYQADVVVSTAQHEFFGAATVEACACGCLPILPRRLSYPELIPAAYHPACLYDDFNGLLDRLRGALLRIEETRRSGAALSAHMARFDWQQMAPRYDALLGRVAAGGSGRSQDLS